MNKETCPCGSQKNFETCCLPYISGKDLPPTPEALMRSRYSAYTQANIPYIEKTQCARAAQGFDPVAAAQWAEQAEWLGLTVLHASKVKKGRGFVEFEAHYRVGPQAQCIHEKSEFRLIEKRWCYVSGEHH